jgi:transglutaminase-like putative cysteine protease
MVRLNYYFNTKVSFSEKINSHSFLLRCTPRSFDFQKILNVHCSLGDSKGVSVGIDNFGNIVHSGSIQEKHDYFEFVSEGTVELTPYRIEEPLNSLFLYQSKYTQFMPNIDELYQQIEVSDSATPLEKVMLFSNKLRESVDYESWVTNTQTTASEALRIGKGVCQDYAHLLITLCRKSGVAARYVAGFMEGEGFTHAWIEFYDNGVWLGFDPTHNRLIETGYIKISHGRDYDDCAIERGIFNGLAQQKMEVILKVEQQQ